MGRRFFSTANGCLLPSSNCTQTPANLATVASGRVTGSMACGTRSSYLRTSSGKSFLLCCWRPLPGGPSGAASEFSSTATTTRWSMSGGLGRPSTRHSCASFGRCSSRQRNNFTVLLKHIPGVDNSIADSLSRSQLHRFHLLAPGADTHATPTPAVGIFH